VLYCSLDQANHEYVIQQNDLHQYPKLALEAECGIAWFNYFIENC
jgi:hypothetical protein